MPFGVIVTKLAGAADPRTIGSGNIGATNVLRTGRKGLAALTLLLDGGKGAAAVLIAEALMPGFGPLASVGVFFGHLFPVWLRFKGGKGVATLLGIALALDWRIGLIAIAVWLLVTLITRISSLGGMSTAFSAPLAAAFLFRADPGDPLPRLRAGAAVEASRQYRAPAAGRRAPDRTQHLWLKPRPSMRTGSHGSG